MATYLTYDATAQNKEDISNVISNITPDKTPLFSMFGRTEATGTYHQWLEDSLSDPEENAHVEGADFETKKGDSPQRKGNYTQIFTKGYSVSRSQEKMLKYGYKSEIARKMLKAMKEIARDVEWAYINNISAQAGSATTPRKLGGIQAFIATNVLDNSGTARDLTEDLLNDALQQAWQNGSADPDTVVCCGKHKRIISGFTAGATKNIEATSKKLVASVDVYESDFGVVRIIPHRFMPTDRLFVIDKATWKTAYFDPFKTETLAKVGDRTEKVIVGELTLEARIEMSNAIIKDLN